MKKNHYLANIAYITTVIILILASGCGFTNSSKVKKHLNNAQKHIDSGNLEKARIELINVLAIRPSQVKAVEMMSDVLFRQQKYSDAFRMLLSASELNPTNITTKTRLGQIYLAGRKFAEARTEAQAILQIDSEYELGVLLFADASFSQEDINKAKQMLTPFLNKPSTSEAVLIALGNLQLKEDDLQGAKETYKLALAKNEKSPAIYRSLGKIALSEKNMQLAEDYFRLAHDYSEADSQYRLAYADFLLKIGKRDECKKILAEIVKENSNSSIAAVSLAEFQFREKVYDEAEKYAMEALKRNENEWRAQAILARIKLVNGDLDGGIKDLDKLLKEIQNEPTLHYGLAQGHFLKGEFKEAEIQLNLALDMFPNFIEASVLRSQLYVQTGRYLEAMPALNQAVQLNPSTPKVHYLMARALVGIGNTESAMMVYDEIHQKFENEFMCFYLKGLIQRLNDSDAAKISFNDCLKIAPGFMPAFYQMIELDITQQKFTEAETKINVKLTDYPGTAGLYYYLAKVRIAENKINEAEKILLENVQLRPEHKDSYYLLSQIYASQNRLEEAEKQIKTLVNNNPSSPGIAFLLGMNLEQSKKYEDAIKIYQEILIDNPDFAPALNNLSYLLSEYKNNHEEALSLAQKARNLVPGDPYIADTLGWILTKNGDYNTAGTLITEALEKLPNNMEIGGHFALICYYQGKLQQAEELIDGLLKPNVDFTNKEKLILCREFLRTIDTPVSIETKNKMIKYVQENPNDQTTKIILAKIYINNKEQEFADELFKNAFPSANDNPFALHETSVYLAKTNSNQQKALEYAEKAFQLNPSKIEYISNLGILCYQNKKYSRAYQILKDVDQKNKSTADLLFYLAKCEFALNNLENSRIQMQRAIDAGLNSELENAAKWWIKLVNIIQNETDYSQEKENLDKILKIDPEFGPALMLYAGSYSSSAEYEKAVLEYKKLLELYPNLNMAKYHIGKILADHLGKHDEAYNYILQARQSGEIEADLDVLFGRILYNKKNYEIAVQILKPFADDKEPDPKAVVYLALSYNKIKNEKDSFKYANQALSMNLSGVEIQMMEEIINKK